jgi:hypothetical protein
VEEGQNEILTYPSPEIKVKLQIDFIRKISECEKK